jgi:hypothetical protein
MSNIKLKLGMLVLKMEKEFLIFLKENLMLSNLKLIQKIDKFHNLAL